MTTEDHCTDSLDNDGDGAVDCDDEECLMDRDCYTPEEVKKILQDLRSLLRPIDTQR